MRNNLFFCCLMTTFLVSQKSYSQKSLQVINNTGNKMWIAIGIWSGNEQGIVTQGWYYLKPYTGALLVENTNQTSCYMYVKQNLYTGKDIFGEKQYKVIDRFASGVPLCLSHQESGFKIFDALDGSCPERGPFRKLSLNNFGVNTIRLD